MAVLGEVRSRVSVVWIGKKEGVVENQYRGGSMGLLQCLWK
jgi:hypothetical protein